MDWCAMLKHYKDGLDPNKPLIEEAILSLEQWFNYMNKDELIHHSRPIALAYLALKEVQTTGEQ